MTPRAKQLLGLALVLSLVANAGLLKLRFKRDHATSAAGGTTSGGQIAAVASPPPAAAMADRAPGVDGSLLRDELSSLVNELRNAGYPEKLVHAAARGMISDQLMKRREALRSADRPPAFWKAPLTTVDPAIKDAERALARDEQALLRELFGDSALTDDRRRSLHNRFGPLPDEKLEALERIEMDYSDLSSRVTDPAQGAFFPWDREQLALLQREKRADIVALLGPQELLAHDLRTSTTSRMLRSRLDLFEPTEQEFVTLFQLQQPFDEKFPLELTGPAEQQALAAKRRDAQYELNLQIRAALGESRSADYVLAQDFAYRTAARLTDRLNLPRANALAAYNVQQDIQKRATVLANDATLAAADKSAGFAALAREASDKLAPLLSADGVEAYKRSAGWLRSLESGRPPAPTPPLP